ncbi:Fe-S protein assembly co-chaperone HscB [Moraxella oculi]|uniref:Fe-S protein assembly co-chaperone HscB n=1 Tax=Moraxella oculi TaxID=2940516 RepID=A0ABW8U805_9GAMM
MQSNNHFFEMFGLPIAFNIDQTALKNSFLQLQKQHHPDHVNDTTSAEKNAALINHAFDILSNHDSRAAYLLELANVDFNADQSICDESFLMQMMAHRMDLEDAILEQNFEQIQEVGMQVSKLLSDIAEQFDFAYLNQDWPAAKTQAQKLKFLSNLHKDCMCALIQLPNHSDDDLYV